jgi:DNA phosphorothioation-dependent restriction protein DptG
MTLSVPDYEKIKWIVSRNAISQAKHDVDNLSISKIKNYIEDPFLYESYVRVMNKWKLSGKTKVIFVQSDSKLVEKLSNRQREVLIEHWVFQFYITSTSLMRERLDYAGI